MNELGLGIVVTMKDAFSQNAGRIQSSMQSLDSSVAKSSERMAKNLDRIQKGTMMIGAGLSMMALPTALVASTTATQRALGEVASLGVKDLRALEDAAESFTNTWSGSSKAEFISASYDVRSAISGLTDEAVGVFTQMAAMTAKATKATTDEMVGTFTTAYGIFKPLMKEYSDMDWAKTFSGAMAQTVASFKTNGRQMADAIKNIGAVAASANIPLQEQLAVLGSLQTTMPGSEAGTLYKAFIMKAAEAGQSLGLSFVDSMGRLKGVLPILKEIKKKFPDLSKAAAQIEIKKAFGSDEAVKFLLQMSQGMEGLDNNIQSIQKAMKGGTAVTKEMANAMNMDIGSQFTLLRQQVSNLFEILGRTLLPVVTPVIQGISKAIIFFQKLAKSMPGLVRVLLTVSMALGAVLVVFGGVIAVAGTIGLMLPAIKAGLIAMGAAITGVGSAFVTFFLPVVAIIGGMVLAVYLLKKAWSSNFAGIRDIVLGTWEKVKLVFQGISSLIQSFKGGSGELSADLAKKLEQAGLMGLVTTVFKVYYRVRQFLRGLYQAFSNTFGKIRTILEPPMRVLMEAFSSLFQVISEVMGIFGQAATSTGVSSYKNLGYTLGSLIGVFTQVSAYILKYIVYGLVAVISIIAPVVKAFMWMGKAIVTSTVIGAKFLYKFFLPLRMLGQTVQSSIEIVKSLWQILNGDISIVDGLKAIGKSIFDYISTPFRWLQDVVVGVWRVMKDTFTGIIGLFQKAVSQVMSLFMNLPIMQTMADVLSAIRNLFSGDINFFDAGKSILITLGKGIWSTATYPYKIIMKALGWIRKLLPFSDAEIGPLSNLTQSGASILQTLTKGMLSSISLPGSIFNPAVA